jgi:hypothetical protein
LHGSDLVITDINPTTIDSGIPANHRKISSQEQLKADLEKYPSAAWRN